MAIKALDTEQQPLHGDAHTGNILSTPNGLLWSDFEDTCRGSVCWDLASATLTDDAVAGYPHPIDPEQLALYRDVRRLQILANLLADDEPFEGRNVLIRELVTALERRQTLG